MKEVENTNYLDSLLVDAQNPQDTYAKILYLGVDVPFEIQIAIIRGLLMKIGIVDEVILLKKGRQIGQSREIIIGAGRQFGVQSCCYIRKFKSIRLLAVAKNKEELLRLFEDLNEGYSQY